MTQPADHHLDQEISEIEALIREAFSGVERGDGISWTEAAVIDRYGTQAERDAARRADAEYDSGRDWPALVGDARWDDEPDVFLRFDEKSNLYYFPARMLRALHRRHPGEFTLYLTRATEWAPSMTPQQAVSVARFVGYMLERVKHTGDEDPRSIFISYLREEYEMSWKRLLNEDPALVLDDWRSWYESVTSLLPETLVDEASEVEQQIREAFHGVTREKGVSWTEAEAIDRGRSEAELLAARALDIEMSWESLVDDPLWNHEVGIGGFSFLDLVGFRYYIAPAMIRATRYGGGGSLDFALSADSEYRTSRLDALSTSQLQATARFVRFMIKAYEVRGDAISGTSWHDPYRRFWSKHDGANKGG